MTDDPTCPTHDVILEWDGLLDAWWCWRCRTHWLIDHDGYLREQIGLLP